MLYKQMLFEWTTEGWVRLGQSPSIFDTELKLAEQVMQGWQDACADIPLTQLEQFNADFGKNYLAVFQVQDRPIAGTDRKRRLFRCLLIGRNHYLQVGQPQQLQSRFPLDWAAHGELPEEIESKHRFQKLSVEEAHEILHRGNVPMILGVVQALVDGSRIILQHEENVLDFIGTLWHFLPFSNRMELRYCSLTTSLNQRHHLVALQELPKPTPLGYINAEQASDYPEGRYERSLQIAIESRDQAEWERLLVRRSSVETLNLALSILGAGIALALINKLFF